MSVVLKPRQFSFAIRAFIRLESAGGVLLLFATALAMIAARTCDI